MMVRRALQVRVEANLYTAGGPRRSRCSLDSWTEQLAAAEIFERSVVHSFPKGQQILEVAHLPLRTRRCYAPRWK